MSKRTEEEWKALMMGYMDGELEPAETQEVHDRIARDPAFRAEYDALCGVCGKLQRVTPEEPDEAVLRRLWRSPGSRGIQTACWILILGGYAALIGLGLREFLSDEGEAPGPRIAVAAVVLGLAILLVHAILNRAFSYSQDPYRNIER